MMKNSFIFWVIVIFIFSGCNSFAQELKFQEKEDGILLLENGSPRYFYKVRAMDSLNEFSRTNYIHPLTITGFSGPGTSCMLMVNELPIHG